jgi:hypothetical protein
MKRIVFVIFLSFSMLVLSQETIEKTTGEFSTLKVYDLINVKMKKSDVNKVIISGDRKEEVEIVNNNGKLKIRMGIEGFYEGDDTVVLLYYTSVDVIDANEGAEVTVDESIKQFEIDFKAQEGAEITASVNSTYVNVRAVTGGIINLKGTAVKQDISIYTGGILNAKDLITESTEISVNAAGEAYIHATKDVDVRIKAGGNVYIYGDPKTVDESRVFGGRIKIM